MKRYAMGSKKKKTGNKVTVKRTAKKYALESDMKAGHRMLADQLMMAEADAYKSMAGLGKALLEDVEAVDERVSVLTNVAVAVLLLVFLTNAVFIWWVV